jgi:transposase
MAAGSYIPRIRDNSLHLPLQPESSLTRYPHERFDSHSDGPGASASDDAASYAEPGSPADERTCCCWTTAGRAERVAEVLFIDAETVREHRRLYETSGVAGLEQLNYEGSEPALSEAQLDALKTELDTHLYMTAKAVSAFVRCWFGVSYTPNAMTKLLKRLGFVYKKPKCVPAKADAAMQEKFAREKLLPLMAQARPQHSLYFVDGMHPSYTAHPALGWIRRGVTRELKSHHGRVNINGALPGRSRQTDARSHGGCRAALTDASRSGPTHRQSTPSGRPWPRLGTGS